MNNFKNNRPISFIILFLIYALCSFAGIMSFNYLSGELWLRIFLADVIATVLTFIFSLIFKNASVYDPYWSVQPLVILAYCTYRCNINLLGLLMIIAVFYWGIRLTANWAYTFENLNSQDWRYTMLHEKTGFFYPLINFIGIHMVPTVIVFFCTLPAVITIVDQSSFRWPCLIFIFISIGAATLQLISDIQMHTYRKNRNGPFNLNGIWRFSRHPNYLGEISMWWGIGGCAVAANPDKWYLLLGAFINTILFLCVSIPMAEGRQSKKEGFKEYKEKTPLLLILPVKK